ncbi:MAG: BrnT family toxin, partial [Candidatus Marinimicrobia bacterium]|nr:BrnT family toxin [Candidatus Neomarinimicrobiota bacterium]
MSKGSFEWDSEKNIINQKKHGVSFSLAQLAFTDKSRIIARDLKHSMAEQRFYCFGRVKEEIITVRFTYRGNIIRIIGAGYW